jgi:UDP-N-acetylglucosamine transferase subunit ALG13
MFPFDRLIRAVDEIAGRTGAQAFFAQIGDGHYDPVHMPFVRFLPREEFARLLAEAEMVLSHAGVGMIADTLKLRKPLLVLPRQERLGEHVNDHQQGTARRFEALNHVLVAESEAAIEGQLARLRTFVPTTRSARTRDLALRVSAALGATPSRLSGWRIDLT